MGQPSGHTPGAASSSQDETSQQSGILQKAGSWLGSAASTVNAGVNSAANAVVKTVTLGYYSADDAAGFAEQHVTTGLVPDAVKKAQGTEAKTKAFQANSAKLEAEHPEATKVGKVAGEVGAVTAGVNLVLGTGIAVGGALLGGGEVAAAGVGLGGVAADGVAVGRNAVQGGAKLIGHEAGDVSTEGVLTEGSNAARQTEGAAARAGQSAPKEAPGTNLAKVEEGGGKSLVPREEGMPELRLESNAGRLPLMSRGTAALTLAGAAGIGAYQLSRNGKPNPAAMRTTQALASTGRHGHHGGSSNPNAGDRPGSVSPDDLNMASLDAARQTRGVAPDGHLDSLAKSGGEGPDAARVIRHFYGLDGSQGQPQEGQPQQQTAPLQQQQQGQYIASQGNNVPPGTLAVVGVHNEEILKLKDTGGGKNLVHVWGKVKPGPFGSPGGRPG